MSQPIVQVQARLGSSRLPGKVLFPLNGCRILAWVIERCQAAELPNNVAVTTGDRSENDAIVEWCKRNDVFVKRGPEDDLLERHRELAHQLDSDPVVRITGDCPFIPPSEIDRLLEIHDRNDAQYTTNVADDMPLGTAVDVIDRDVLDDLAELDEDHPVIRMRESPEMWGVAFSSNARWTEHASAHISIDTPEDYWTLVDAVDAVGSDPMAVTRWVAGEDI